MCGTVSMTDKGMQLCRNLVSPLVEEKCHEFAMQLSPQAHDFRYVPKASWGHYPFDPVESNHYEYCIQSRKHNCTHEVSSS